MGFHPGGMNFPAFNIADAAIVGGAVGIALFGLFDGGKRNKA